MSSSKKIVKELVSSYYSTVLIGLEEYENEFIYTKAIIKFIDELKEKGIELDMNNVFKNEFIDNVYFEINKYLGKGKIFKI